MTIAELIEAASDTSNSIYSVLVRTKVLASRIGNNQLEEWVNREINGYGDVDTSLIPMYRSVGVLTTCTLTQGYTVRPNEPFPIMYFPKEDRDSFKVTQERNGIIAIEARLKSATPDDFYGQVFGIDSSAILTSEVKKQIPNLSISDVKMVIPSTELELVLAGVRGKLLELLLQVEKEFPAIEDVANESNEMKEKVSRFITNIFFAAGSNAAFDTTNIAISGHDNTIAAAVGSDNSTKITPNDT